VQFIDAEPFDVRNAKSCIPIAHPDGKRPIPIDALNMFYRGELESTRLAGLRERKRSGDGLNSLAARQV
jgi:hypothetical protein